MPNEQPTNKTPILTAYTAKCPICRWPLDKHDDDICRVSLSSKLKHLETRQNIQIILIGLFFALDLAVIFNTINYICR